MALLQSDLRSSGHLAHDERDQAYMSCRKAHSGRSVSLLRWSCGTLSHGISEKELLRESPRMYDYVLGESNPEASPEPERSSERR